MKSDPHHCHCFKILKNHFELFRTKLESIGFHDAIQIQKGQIFGLIKNINDKKQIHIKVMPSGQIEAEIEPSQDFPIAHLNSKHSYSAHRQLQNLLHQLGIPYIKNWSMPLSCVRPLIVEPFKPTHVKVIVGALIAVALVGIIGIVIAKSVRN